MGRVIFATAVLMLCLLGAAARLARWEQVFTPSGVELVPTDSHYYVRFARLQRQAFPDFRRFDPYVGFPDGAAIHWPPLHTWSVAAAIALGDGRDEAAVA